MDSTKEPEQEELSQEVPDIEIELEPEPEPEDEIEIEPEPEPIVLKIKSKQQKVKGKVAEVTQDLSSSQVSQDLDPVARKKELKRLQNLRYRDKNKPVKPIVVEKLVYVMVDKDGDELERINPKKISRKDEKKMLIEEEARQKELELGMKLGRLKSGKAKLPRERSAAQKANDEKLGKFMREKRAAALKVKNDAKTEVKKKSLVEALREIITIPIADIQQPPAPPEILKRVKSFAEW
jgi:hypothetical protein